MEVVEHQMMVGEEVVVHVLQGPEEDMIQAHQEGEGVVGLRGEEDLWKHITDKVVIKTTLNNENNRTIQIKPRPYLTVAPLEEVEGQVLPMVVLKSC